VLPSLDAHFETNCGLGLPDGRVKPEIWDSASVSDFSAIATIFHTRTPQSLSDSVRGWGVSIDLGLAVDKSILDGLALGNNYGDG
jgi:hypothetical protein